MVDVLLIEGALILELDADADRPSRGDILIADGRIAAVGPGLSDPAHPARSGLPPPARTLDGRRRLAIPGFVNAHYHSHDVLLKGMFDPLPLEQWNLLALPPSYPRRPKAELRLRTLLGAAECLRGGITTVADMNRIQPFDEEDMDIVLAAYEQAGIRVVYAPHFSEVPPTVTTPFLTDCIPEGELWRLSGAPPMFARGEDGLARMEAAITARHGRHARIGFALGPSAPERVRAETVPRMAELSSRLGIPVFTHLYESRASVVHARRAMPGGSIVQLMAEAGLLNERLTLAHCVWLTEDEIARLAGSGANLVLNMIGNLKTRSGVAPVKAFRRAGARLALGADNCSCSDAQNLFQVMKAFCTLPAVSDDPDEAPPPATDALRAATEGGARAVGLAGEVGAIRPGMRADIVLLDLSDPSFVPLNSAARQLVFTESGRAVRTVLVDGRVVLDEGRLTTIDEAALAEEVAAVMPALHADAAVVRDRLAPIFPLMEQANSRAWAEPVPLWRYVGGCPACGTRGLRADAV